MDLVARDPGSWETFPEAMQHVTSDDVQRVASTYLVEQQRTAGWFVPVPQNTSNGEAR
jgi:predicted Zn-dependent peptidase